jgi:hypothetical protein
MRRMGLGGNIVAVGAGPRAVRYEVEGVDMSRV